MNTPLHPWRNFGADRDSQRRFPLIISLLAFLFSTFSLALFGQSRTAHPHGAPAQAAAVPAAAPSNNGARRELSASLADLERVSQATDSDIANLHVEKWGSGWSKTILRSKDEHQQQAQQVAASLQRNLHYAMPDLIHDVQNARGSVSTTFKLYDNLSVVCEALDSLINTAESKGKKEESAPLNEDYNALVRLRREFSSYIQTASVSLETKGKLPAYTATGSSHGAQTVTGPGGVKRIVVDDTVPEKKPAAAPVHKKKPAAAAPTSAASEPATPASAPAPLTARVAAPPAVPASAAAPAASSASTLAPAPSPSPTPKKKATIYYSN
jgi:hypothetical protein